MVIFFLLGEVADNDEDPKGKDAAHVGQGSADCLALHKKGLYVAGQVCHNQITSSLYENIRGLYHNDRQKNSQREFFGLIQ